MHLSVLNANMIFLSNCIRFAGIREAAKPHEKLTFLSTTAGILLLALGFLIPPSGYPDMQTAVGIAAATSVACHFLFKQKPKLEEPITLAIGFSFIGASLYRCVLGKIWGGVAGTLIFATAGLLGTDGNIKGIKKVDIFHYGVAAGIFLISQGLLQVW